MSIPLDPRQWRPRWEQLSEEQRAPLRTLFRAILFVAALRVFGAFISKNPSRSYQQQQQAQFSASTMHRQDHYYRPDSNDDYNYEREHAANQENERAMSGAAYGLGSLPGDISMDVGGIHVYAPMATSVVLSIALSLLFRFLQQQAARQEEARYQRTRAEPPPARPEAQNQG